MKVAVRYFTEFGSSVSTMESSELASWIKRYNFKISSITEVDEEESKVPKKEITHEEIFNDVKKAKLKEFIDKFKGQELFKKSNDRAREILASIKWLPKVCNDCNTALESCTCIEDTLEIEDVELEEDEFCYYSGLPSPKAYEEETKCYCGHTTTCDCGPKDIEDEK
jgi:hypothetical protein